jgi:nitroimidazol reductase NimA-like FMN-containing flavoprotein (pyridoxamine 5'-phosphate oxidase superfamily)
MKSINRKENEQKIKFSDNEIKFLLGNEGCRIATVSPDNTPHITPVSYIFEDGFFYFATDYNTRKYKNLKTNPNVALVVDIYSSVINRAVIVQGKVTIIEQGKEFQKLYDNFNTRFEWVRIDPWNEGQAPFIRVNPYKKISWGLD